MDSLRKITLQRTTGHKRTGEKTLAGQIDYLVERALSGARRGWKLAEKNILPIRQDPSGNWVYEVDFAFTIPPDEDSRQEIETQWQGIRTVIEKAGENARYNPYPWGIITTPDRRDVLVDPADKDEESDEAPDAGEEESEAPEEEHPRIIQTVDDLYSNFPEKLLRASNEEIENHPAFEGIYGRGPQIRILLHAIWGAILSDFTVTNHCLLYGLTSCAKSQIKSAIKKVLGDGACDEFYAPSTTKAGIQKKYLKTYGKHYPRIVFIEEIEKAKEDALDVWLSMMDDSREISKTNFRGENRRQINILCIATCNDKAALDRFMASSKAKVPGALSSRFVNQLYVPRPNREEMERILLREVNQMQDGKEQWVDQCLQLMDDIQDEELADVGKATDPRWIKSWLDGRERLETGDYQEDFLNVLRRAKYDDNAYRFRAEPTDQEIARGGTIKRRKRTAY